MNNFNRHKLAALTMLGAYPTIVVLLVILQPLLGHAPMPLRAAALVPLMVLLLTYTVMPLLTRIFSSWLQGETASNRLIATVGLLAAIPLGVLFADGRQHIDEPHQEASALDGMAVDHVMINVSDFERSVEWYSKNLGFKETVRWTVDGLLETDLAYLKRGNFLIELASSPKTDATASLPRATDFASHFGQRGITHLCFKVHDVDAVLAELNKNGVPTFSSAIDFPALDVRVGFIQDPDGNVIEFKGPTAGNSVVEGKATWASKPSQDFSSSIDEVQIRATLNK